MRIHFVAGGVILLPVRRDTVTRAIPPETTIGSVALAVPDPASVAAFYRNIIGLDRLDGTDDGIILGVGDRSLIRLIECASDGDPNRTAGLYHLALRVPTRPALGDALARISRTDALTGASDHGFSEALYLRDPAGNGVEVYRDRERNRWPRTAGGGLRTVTDPLDLDEVAEAAGGESALPAGTDMGHVHLAVSDIERSLGFYRDLVGFAVSMRPRDDVAFMAAGEYHHHVAVNTWERRQGSSSDPGLRWFSLMLPAPRDRDELADRLAEDDVIVEQAEGDIRVRDPDGIGVRLGCDD